VPRKPEESLLYQLVASGEMPPLGSRIVDESGRAALAAWIESMPRTEVRPFDGKH
jgi:mono/diheme cytochrome c family protein